MSGTASTTTADATTDATTPSPRAPSGARAGAVAMLPLVAAYAPFAVVIGATSAEAGDALAGWSGSWLIFGGSAHLAALRTSAPSGPVLAILTGLIVHARLAVYSASLAQRWRGQPRWFRVAAAGLIIDPTWAIAQAHAEQHPSRREQRRHFLGAGLTLGVGWSAAMAAGAVVGDRPGLAALDLDVVVPMCVLAALGPALRSRSARRVVAVAACTATLGAPAPGGAGLLAAIVLGTVAGLRGDRSSA